MNIEELRSRIDRVDKQILNLFLKRLSYCEEIANLKNEANISVFDEKREARILKNVVSNSGQYKSESMRLFTEIMSICKELQYKAIKS